MNRDISQLLALLAGMQGDLVSLRTGLAALAKDIQTLQGQVQAVNPEHIARDVRTAAKEGAAREVARAADSAHRAAQSVDVAAVMVSAGMRLRRRWKIAPIFLIAILVFSAGFGSSGLLGIWDSYGCRAHGGAWVVEPSVAACVFR